jgi:agmatine deiminase
VELIAAALDDAWFRDNGPTFLLGRGGRLGAVLWTFNGWGGRIACTERDRAAARLAARRASATVFESTLVNEGGAIAVDGAGTVLVTDTVQANPNRNPTWDRRAIEQELRARLGGGTVVWLARGLDGDGGANGTDGHVDTLAAFVRPGVLVVHHQPDPDHPDHAVMAENRARLSAARDHAGRRFELVELAAPVAGREGHASHESYVNFAWVNGGVVLCGFGDAARDAAVHATFRRLLPERRISQIDASTIFRHGGGIHCITQPEPAATARW